MSIADTGFIAKGKNQFKKMFPHQRNSKPALFVFGLAFMSSAIISYFTSNSLLTSLVWGFLFGVLCFTQYALIGGLIDNNKTVKHIKNIQRKADLIENELNKRGSDLKEVVKSVDNISYKCNLLSLNVLLTALYSTNRDNPQIVSEYYDVLVENLLIKDGNNGDNLNQTETAGGLRALLRHYSPHRKISVEAQNHRVAVVKELLENYSFDFLRWLNFLDLNRDYLDTRGITTPILIESLIEHRHKEQGLTDKLPFEWLAPFVIDTDYLERINRHNSSEPVNMKEINAIIEREANSIVFNDSTVSTLNKNAS